MSGKTKFLSLAALAACFGWAGAASAAPTLTINLKYIGSTTANTQSGLVLMDLNSPTTQSTANLKNYFDVYMLLSPDAGSQQAFANAAFDLTFGAGIVPSARNGTQNLTTNKIFANSPTSSATGVAVFSNPLSDQGANAGDLVGLFIANQNVDNAYADLVGTSSADSAIGFTAGLGSKIGNFCMMFTGGALTHNTSIQAFGSAGDNLTVFINPNADTAAFNGVVGTPFVIQGVPEPASLGVLALGGLALLARRRKAC
jgi:hypothetical protein